MPTMLPKVSAVKLADPTVSAQVLSGLEDKVP